MPLNAAVFPQFQLASDQSLVVYFADKITLDAHRQVLRLLRYLESHPVSAIRNLHPAYASLLIVFDPLRVGHDGLIAILKSYIEQSEEIPLPQPRTFHIPVCYGGAYGPDLNDVAAIHRMTLRDVVELHSSLDYRVYFFGFVPGFAYLGQLPPQLITPRLSTPRTIVPRGSVGIADSQTGVYPFETPGGWRLLGRTPIAMFHPTNTGIGPVSIGDLVKFMPISEREFDDLRRENS
jgi:inhibitor of KinA